MIASLSGRLADAAEDSAVVDVGGVGYLVYCSGRTLRALPPVGQAVSLVVETHVREDHIHLYGFQTPVERDWFRLLQTVQGVGARLALAVLSLLAPDELATAIAAQDTASLRNVSGVGPKAAQRIVAELKDRAHAVSPSVIVVADAAGAAGEGGTGEAVSALVNLGYSRGEAFTAVATAARELGEGADVGGLIRRGLKVLAPA
ncbi:MAG: Holliday junction branch migration protein RuvA [Alphaproteobacteria bacterium]|nr:Holliday junction branch migration protein RuvA [Alphaproteobacteria bacterium]